ncbi:MAG: DUF1640 domain-containing protein [Chromatiaceae bacterium]|nr:MAG: DUF1640 domain-containing protein [Chromatiaceae bacterium]
MTLALRLYEQITHGADENARFGAVAEAIELLEQRLADHASLATRADVHATELRLQKEIEQVRLQTEQVRGEIEQVRGEIEQVRGEIKAVELRLQKEIAEVRGEIKAVELNLRKEIEQVRGDIKTVELRLQKEIAQVRSEIEQVRLEVKSVEVRLVQAMHWQTVWIIGAVGTVVAAIRLLDYLLP